MFNHSKLKAMNRATFSMLFFVKWKKQLKNGEVPVYLRINHNSTNTEISIKRSIKPEAWDATKNKAKGNSPEAKEINDYINSIRGQLFNIQKELQESGKPVTAKALANAFQGVGEKQWTLVELFTQHNDNMQKLIGTEYAPLTLQRFQAALKHIETFCTNQYKDKNLPLAAVDIKFITYKL